MWLVQVLYEEHVSFSRLPSINRALACSKVGFSNDVQVTGIISESSRLAISGPLLWKWKWNQCPSVPSYWDMLYIHFSAACIFTQAHNLLSADNSVLRSKPMTRIASTP